MARGPSYFGGYYNAVNFAYGWPGGPEALSIHNVPIAASTTALNLAFGYCTTQDGLTFYPIATNTPIYVGGDSNQERITPSAASAANPGYGAMNFTATFSNAHGEGDPVLSGTFGLQEAIDLANAQGGGIVIIDNQWAAIGGTTAIRLAAVLPSPVIVQIQDNRT